MIGPMSVDGSCGSPIASSAAAPRIDSSRVSASSFCTHSTRSAEQRWPALRKAERITSSVVCSTSAEESAIITFWPPVSAMNGTMGRIGFSASAIWIFAAVSVPPVNATPAIPGWFTSAPPMSPAPNTSCSASGGTPQACSRSTAIFAMRGVCSAGFASTVLPASRAAETWPMKIASGKFQGLMHTNTPRPCRLRSFDSPVGPSLSRAGAPKSRSAWQA